MSNLNKEKTKKTNREKYLEYLAKLTTEKLAEVICAGECAFCPMHKVYETSICDSKEYDGLMCKESIEKWLNKTS